MPALVNYAEWPVVANRPLGDRPRDPLTFDFDPVHIGCAQIFDGNVRIFAGIETRRMPETGGIPIPNGPANFERCAQILHMPAWVQQSDQLEIVRSKPTAPDGPLTINAPLAVAHYHFL